jgi:hypothetical protein
VEKGPGRDVGMMYQIDERTRVVYRRIWRSSMYPVLIKSWRTSFDAFYTTMVLKLVGPRMTADRPRDNACVRERPSAGDYKEDRRLEGARRLRGEEAV